MRGERIKKIRVKRGLSQTDLADKIGVSKQTLYKYENGLITNVPSDKIAEIARVCGVSPAYLLGWIDTENIDLRSTFLTQDYAEANAPDIESLRRNSTKMDIVNAVVAPLLGKTEAGHPISIFSEAEEIINLDLKEFSAEYKYFALRIQGDSMEPRIHNGDIAIIRQQDDVESGEVAIVTLNREDTVCKRLLKTPESVILMSYNTNYPPIEIQNDGNSTVEILGRVMETRSKF